MKRHRLDFRYLVGGLGLLVIGLGLAFVFWPRTRMNVILITLDTARADHFGCYGYSRARTPAVDAMADQGVLFERAYAPAPVTLPSHASMFSGLYPPEHGLHSNGRGRLGSSIPVLAETLRNANYETGAFVASFVLNSKFGLDRGFQTYDDKFSDAAADHPEHQRRDGRLVVDAALSWMQGRITRPFLCWIHLYDAHAQYDARPETFGGAFAEQPYDAGIAYADLQVQRVRKFVQNWKLEDRTLIVIVGDHGEDLMEHQEMQHGDQLYDSTLRVPLIFAGSPCVKSRGRVAESVSLVDLAPTILDCLNAVQLESTTGRSFKAALAGRPIEPRLCYLETDLPFLENRWAPLRGIVADRWKYIETTHSELFDLVNDPRETQNLAETQPEKFRELQNVFEEFSGKMVPREASSVNLTDNERRILESLGYMAGRSIQKQPAIADRLPDIKEMLPLFNQLMIARKLLRDGAVDEAIEKLEKIRAKAPDYFKANLVFGDALWAKQRISEAVAIYQAVAAERPDIGDAEGRWANALAAQGLFDEAVLHYRKVLEIIPEASAYRIKLALALNQLGRLREAVAELEEAVRDNPQNLDAHLELGGLLMQGGRMKEAIPHYEEVLKLQPAQLFVRLNLASALAHERRYTDAITHATKAIEDAPESFEARYTLGAILLTQSKYREAIVQLTEACRLRPDDLTVRTQLQQAKEVVDRQNPRPKLP